MKARSRKKMSDGSEALTGVDIIQPALQAHVEVGEALAGIKFKPGTVGALRDICQHHAINRQAHYELYVPEAIPQNILNTPLAKLDDGDSWRLGTFGPVRVYAQKNEGFYTTESEAQKDVEFMCELVAKGLQAPKVITLHFATAKTDKIVEAWCKANNIGFKRMYPLPPDSPTPDKSKTSTPQPPIDHPSSATMRLPKK